MHYPLDERDEELLKGIRLGEQSAMKSLYDTYIGYLRGVVTRYVPDTAISQDILQETFVRVFTLLDSFEYRGKGSLRAWMTRIAINESLGYLRKEKRTVLLDDQKLSDLEDSETEEYCEENLEANDIPVEQLMDFIKALPDGFRMVFNLYVIEGKSHKEIATLLGISEGTSASQYHRARKRLAQMVMEYRRTRLLENHKSRK